MNEALDGTNTNTNRAATIDDTMKEGNGIEPDEGKEGDEKKEAKNIFYYVGV